WSSAPWTPGCGNRPGRSAHRALLEGKGALLFRRELAARDAGTLDRVRVGIENLVDALQPVREPGTVRDLDVEAGPRGHLEDQGTEVAVDHHVDTHVPEPRHRQAARRRLQDVVPVGDVEAGDRRARVRVLVDDLVPQHAGQRLPGADVDARAHGPLVEVGLAV